MSRRRGSRRAAATARGAPRARGTLPGTARLGLAVLVLGAIAVTLGILRARPWRHEPARPGASAPSVPDSIARLDPDRAYERAVRLVNGRRPLESLPYFRHALSHPGEPMLAHLDYATGLHDAALQSNSRFGWLGFATRSSIERLALMREALAQLDAAERLAATPAERARVHATRAHQFLIWGLPWEALVEFRRAQESDPSWPWAPISDVLAARLHHPERPEPSNEPPETKR